MKINYNQGCNAQIKWLEVLYIGNLNGTITHHYDDTLLEYHKLCAIKTYFLNLNATTVFVNKIATYIDVIYLKYFSNNIHEYGCVIHLVHLYFRDIVHEYGCVFTSWMKQVQDYIVGRKQLSPYGNIHVT